MDNFDKYLKDNLSVSVYEGLAELLTPEGEEPKSPHRITKIKNNAALMDQHELIEMSKLLKKSPAWLVEHFEAGTQGINDKTLEAIVQSSIASEQALSNTASPDAIIQ